MPRVVQGVPRDYVVIFFAHYEWGTTGDTCPCSGKHGLTMADHDHGTEPPAVAALQAEGERLGTLRDKELLRRRCHLWAEPV